MLDARLYTGRSAEIVDKFCGKGGELDSKLASYKEYIAKAGVSELSV
jgi:adenylosuccinate lyase